MTRIAVSHNSRIRYVPNELEAVKRFKVALLILVGQATTAQLAHNFVQTLPGNFPGNLWTSVGLM